jgi:hypothetical protein
LCSQITTSRSASGYGSGLTSIACTTLNSAVVDPMPTASAAMVQIVKSGVRNNTRRPWRRSDQT